MPVLPVFLTQHSSIKVRRENDCKGKTQTLKFQKKQLILLNFNGDNQGICQISIYSCLLVRIFNPQPFRSNICFYVICCFFVFFFALFLNLRRKFKLYFSVQCSQTTSPRHLLDTLSKIRNSRVFSNIAYFT